VVKLVLDPTQDVSVGKVGQWHPTVRVKSLDRGPEPDDPCVDEITKIETLRTPSGLVAVRETHAEWKIGSYELLKGTLIASLYPSG